LTLVVDIDRSLLHEEGPFFNDPSQREFFEKSRDFYVNESDRNSLATLAGVSDLPDGDRRLFIEFAAPGRFNIEQNRFVAQLANVSSDLKNGEQSLQAALRGGVGSYVRCVYLCTGGTAKITVSASVAKTLRLKSRTVGSESLRAAETRQVYGRPKYSRVRLTKAARKAFKRFKRVPVTISIVLKGARGEVVSKSLKQKLIRVEEESELG
jgi:hypothetical protein